MNVTYFINNQTFYSKVGSSTEARIEDESKLIKLTSIKSKFHGTELSFYYFWIINLIYK